MSINPFDGPPRRLTITAVVGVIDVDKFNAAADGKRRTRIHNTRRKLIGMLTDAQLVQLTGTNNSWARGVLVDMINRDWDQHRTTVADAIANMLKVAE